MKTYYCVVKREYNDGKKECFIEEVENTRKPENSVKKIGDYTERTTYFFDKESALFLADWQSTT